MNFSKICIFDETVSILRVVSYIFSSIFSCGLFSVNFVQRKSFHLASRRTDQLKYRREDSNVRKRSQTSKKNNVLLFLGGVLAIPVFS